MMVYVAAADFTFSTTEGFKPVPFATAGDCYSSTKRCPQVSQPVLHGCTQLHRLCQSQGFCPLMCCISKSVYIKKVAHTRYEHWVRSWSRSIGSQPAGDIVINLVVGCHYFPPGPRLPSQPENITALWPVPNYSAWWQRHMGVNNLPRVVTW